MFPNQFNVYLHDTPADSLFARASRSFSHGCVRVEDPVALARVSPAGSARVDDDQNRRSHARRRGEARQAEAADPGVSRLLDGARAAGWIVHFRDDVYGIDGGRRPWSQSELARLRRSVAMAEPTAQRPSAPAIEPGAQKRDRRAASVSRRSRENRSASRAEQLVEIDRLRQIVVGVDLPHPLAARR